MSLTLDNIKKAYDLVNGLPVQPEFDFVTMRERTLLWLKAKNIIGYNLPNELVTWAGVKVLIRETTPEATIAYWKWDKSWHIKDRVNLNYPRLVRMIKLEGI